MWNDLARTFIPLWLGMAVGHYGASRLYGTGSYIHQQNEILRKTIEKNDQELKEIQEKLRQELDALKKPSWWNR